MKKSLVDLETTGVSRSMIYIAYMDSFQVAVL